MNLGNIMTLRVRQDVSAKIQVTDLPIFSSLPQFVLMHFN